jgi:WhiB family redox-sensing transcriptional regulator
VERAVTEALMLPGLDVDVELLRILRPPAWTRRAACQGSRLNFVPSHSAAAKWVKVPDELAAICSGCPVRDECLDMALADGTLSGCWGGTCDRERADLRRRRRLAA